MRSKVEPLLRHRSGAAGQVRVLVGFKGSPAEIERSPLLVEYIGKRTVVGTIHLDDLDALARLDSVVSISADHPLRPQLNQSIPEIGADQVRTAHPELTGKGVIVGIIDSGIDIFHIAFRRKDGSSRVLSILDLTLPPFQIAVTQNAVGGTFRLRFSADGRPPTPTQPLPFNASAQHVRTALQNLQVDPRITAGDLNVTGGPLPNAINVDFVGQYAERETVLTADSTGLMSQGGKAQVVVATLGQEFDAAAIATALDDGSKPFRHRDRRGHGTHVAGIAVGDGSKPIVTPLGDCGGALRYVGVAPEADLIVVKGPDVSAVVRGVGYIFDKAQQVGRPAVVNISLGSQLGAHDGSSEAEIEIDSHLEGTTGRAVVVAAGNQGHGMYHTSRQLEANQVDTTIVMKIPPGKTGSQVIDLWYPDGHANIQVRLVPPPPAPQPPPNQGWVTPSPIPTDEPHNTPLGGHGHLTVPPLFVSPRGKRRIQMILTPSLQPAPAPRSISKGDWTVGLREDNGVATKVDLWTRPDDDLPGRFVPQGEKASTIDIPGTARTVITVGSYDLRNAQLPAATSAHGPTTDLDVPRIKPDICAPGVGIGAPRSGARPISVCCDLCGTFYMFDGGTSQAAPHVAGVVALMLQRNPGLSFEQIRQTIQLSARRPDVAGPPPDNNWGYGKLDALGAVLATPPATPAPAADPGAALDEGAGAAATNRPVLASPAATWPRVVEELGRLQQRLAANPRLALLAGLVSTHFDEVVRLVNNNRRVAARWHRMGGPALVRSLLELLAAGSPEPVIRFAIPDTVDGRPMVDLLRRMLAVLDRYGSPALRADIERHGPVLLALPGRSLAELIPDLGEQGGA